MRVYPVPRPVGADRAVQQTQIIGGLAPSDATHQLTLTAATETDLAVHLDPPLVRAFETDLARVQSPPLMRGSETDLALHLDPPLARAVETDLAVHLDPNVRQARETGTAQPLSVAKAPALRTAYSTDHAPAFGPWAAYDTEVLAAIPALYWRMGESAGTAAADSSGNGRGGTATGNNTQNAAGLITGDVSTGGFFQLGDLVGTVSGIRADAYSPYTTGSALTLSTWIGVFSPSAAWTIFAGSGVTGGQPHPTFEWFPTTNTLRFYASVNTFPFGWVDWEVPFSVSSTAVPYHVALTFDDTTSIAEAFVNGTSLGQRGPNGFNSVQLNWDTTNDPGRFQIGYRGNGTEAESADGWFDEVAVFESVLTPAQIQVLSEAGFRTAPTVAKTVTIGAATETDKAAPLLPLKFPVETDQARVLVPFMGASETDVAVALSVAGPTGQNLTPAVETDLAVHLDPPLVRSAEQDLAVHLDPPLARASEQDAAPHLDPPLVRGSEADLAVHLDPPLVAPAETDSARPLQVSGPIRVDIDPAVETSAALHLNPPLMRGQETDQAVGLSVAKLKTLVLAAEADTAQPLDLDKLATLVVATEQDSGVGVTYTKPISKTVGPASELDESVALITGLEPGLIVVSAGSVTALAGTHGSVTSLAGLFRSAHGLAATHEALTAAGSSSHTETHVTGSYN